MIVSDCEGYEAHLFTPRVAAFLARHDLLIEVHDAGDPELAHTLRARFEASHRITALDSIDDRRKLRTHLFAELAPYDSRTRRRLLSEGRAGVMEWLYLTPRTATPAAAGEHVPLSAAA